VRRRDIHNIIRFFISSFPLFGLSGLSSLWKEGTLVQMQLCVKTVSIVKTVQSVKTV